MPPREGADFDKLPEGVVVDDANHCCCNLVELPAGIRYLSYLAMFLGFITLLNLARVIFYDSKYYTNNGFNYGSWGGLGKIYDSYFSILNLWWIYAGVVSYQYVQKGDTKNLKCAWTGLLVITLFTLNPITIILIYYWRTIVIKTCGGARAGAA